jgi:hypothetical protein
MNCDMVMAIIIIPVVTICQKMAHRQTMGSPLDTTNPDKQTSDTTTPALDKIRPIDTTNSGMKSFLGKITFCKLKYSWL